MVEDIVQTRGYLTLGSRLKRIGERMQADVARFTAEAGLAGQPSVPPLLSALDRSGPLTINELAEALGISQPGVTRSVKQLEAAGLVDATRSDRDLRHKAVALSDAGRDLVARCERDLWPWVEAAVADICADLDGPLLRQLEAIEEALAQKPLDRRAVEFRAKEKKDA